MRLEKNKSNPVTTGLVTSEQPNEEDTLPLELLEKIFCYLREQDLDGLREVNHHVKEAVRITTNHIDYKKIGKINAFAKVLCQNIHDPAIIGKILFIRHSTDNSSLQEIKAKKNLVEKEKIEYLLSVLRTLDEEQLNQLYVKVYDTITKFDQEIEPGFFEILFVVAKFHQEIDRFYKSEDKIEEKELNSSIHFKLDFPNRNIENGDRLPEYFYLFVFEPLAQRFAQFMGKEIIKLSASKEEAFRLMMQDSRWVKGVSETLLEELTNAMSGTRAELKALIKDCAI